MSYHGIVHLDDAGIVLSDQVHDMTMSFTESVQVSDSHWSIVTELPKLAIDLWLS